MCGGFLGDMFKEVDAVDRRFTATRRNLSRDRARAKTQRSVKALAKDLPAIEIALQLPDLGIAGREGTASSDALPSGSLKDGAGGILSAHRTGDADSDFLSLAASSLQATTAKLASASNQGVSKPPIEPHHQAFLVLRPRDRRSTPTQLPFRPKIIAQQLPVIHQVTCLQLRATAPPLQAVSSHVPNPTV